MKKSLFIYSLTALALALGACSDDNKKHEEAPCTGEGCEQLCGDVAMPADKVDCVCVEGAWTECKDAGDANCTGDMPEGKVGCACKDGEWINCSNAGDGSCEGNMPSGKKDCVCKEGEWTECKNIDEPCEGDECGKPSVKTNPILRKMESKNGCSLDADCAEGSFCFEGQCVIQCSSDKSLKLNCSKNYYCDSTRGRCVTQDYLTEMKKVEDEIAAAGDSMSDQDKALLRTSVELNAATMSNVRHSVLGQQTADGKTVESITFSERMPLAKIINEKDKTQKVSFATTDSIGEVQYVVKMDGVDLPVLKTSKGVKNKLGTYTYTFEIDTAQIQKNRRNRLLRSGGTIEPEAENVEIISNAGEFPVILADPVQPEGLYKGYASPVSVLSGIALPIRMGIKTVPAKIANFSEITGLTVMLPVTEGDIFSPENLAEDGTETWSLLQMSKKAASDCSNKKPCWAATYSTNNFAPKGSVLFTEDQHVNRNIRVEIYDFDAPTFTFTGRIVDGLKGLYREKSVEPDKILTSWNDTEMVGEFSVQLSNAIDEAVTSVTHVHEPANEVIRAEADDPLPVCNDDLIAAFMAKIADPETENCDSIDDEVLKQDCKDIQTCKNVKSMDQYNELSKSAQFMCLQKAAIAITDDPASMSNVLSAVLKADAEGQDTTKPAATVCDTDIHNFDEFQTVCAKAGCSLCADHPEYVCGADLLARRYLSNDPKDTENYLDVDAQTDLMNAWIAVIRESYLAQQYMAWNDDNDIRKQWLTGAVYQNTFAASTMKTFNEDLLQKYRDKVLDVQRGIMGKQFAQTTLEMLSQSFISSDPKTLALNTARNTILSELSQTWESVGTALGLSSRRYDVLLQEDVKRIQMAKELRPYLFDLYFSGVLESAINLKADQGSLNAAYGTDLSSIISKLESLDQTFEDLVFMRDGEIFTDTSLDTGDGLTALGKAQKAAKESVEKASTKRKTVFDEMAAKRKEKLSIQDSYLSSLESMRAELVNLCGYPSDCTTDAQHETCKIFTDPYFCGFALDSTSTKGVTIKEKSDDNSISQVTEFDKCIAELKKSNPSMSEADRTIKCAGGNLALESYQVSTTGSTATSEAGIAIQAFREAELEYQTALSEYDVLAQKVRNNYATLDAYAKNIKDWYDARKGVLDQIGANLEKITQYEAAIGEYNSQVSKLELKEMQDEYQKQSEAVAKWDAMAYSNMATQESMQAIITGASIADIWVSKSMNDADQEAQLSALQGILGNTAVIGMGTTATNTQKAQLQSVGSHAAASALGFASAGLQTAIVAAESTAALAQNAFDFSIEQLDRNTDLDIAGLQTKLAEDINKLSITVEGLEGEYDADGLADLIADMERTNELLLAEMENEDTYKRDLQDLDFKRNEFGNIALDLIPLAHTVKVKEIAKYRALLQYLTIAQRAKLVATQYDSKLARYQMVQNALFSASEFFQTASDLESVESFIEYARNDLSDYLAAIEYLTVRPFVEIRRSIYTARGTNDLEKLYEQLNDLTDNCGSGAESTNKVILSLREQLGIPAAEIDGLTPADRFHLTLAKGNLPVSAQTRYTVTGTVSDELKAGSFYSASFNISSHFANIDTSCNAKIDSVKIRFISKEGKKIRESGNLTPSVSLFYGGQTQLLSCHKNIEAIASTIGPRTTYGKFSTFSATPFADGINAGIFEIPEGESYEFSDTTELSDVTDYKGLKGFPLMATYSLVFDPAKGNNSQINWDNVADVEIQINYTTGTLGQDSSKCKYDIQ
ncbi:MAG: hypothetical protein J6A01_08535 [Proteobacteria bacterium]|nr:hypothetical protein [Pseudomonadota bacterium]